MKTYNLKELKDLCNEQGYKLASLENANGERLHANNLMKVKIENHLNILDKRLKGAIYPDGYYYFCLARSMHKSNNPDKYLFVKGKPEMQLSEINKKENTPVITTVHADVLTYESALRMQQQISDLTAENRLLQLENDQLNAMVKEYEETESLNETPTTSTIDNIKSFMSESMPSIMGIMDKYFDTENKKIELEEKKLNLRLTQNPQKNIKPNQPVQKRDRVLVQTGSPEHIALITFLNKSEKEEDTEKLQKELDKLENFNNELYLKVCTDLGIEFEENEEPQN